MHQYDVLVVGGGFGGAFAARRLEHLFKGRGERVLLVAEENFFLFSPLLPEAASGTLEPRHAVIPLREFLPRTTVLTGEVTSLDVAGRRAKAVDLNGHSHEIAFRALILSPGSRPTTRSIPGLAEHAVGFKTLADAIWLRNHVLRQLEAADATDDLELRRQLLSFTFIGGGYSGVEALAELESLTRDAMKRAYPKLRPSDMRWVLVEAADSLLPGLDVRLSRYAERALRKKGIELHLSTQVSSCEGGRVTLSDATVAAYASGTIVWTAGQRPNELARESGLEVDDRGRVPVDPYLRVAGVADTFAIGDGAAVPDPAGTGRPCPPTAQHALRQGIVAANNVAAALGVGDATPFRYRNRGLAVTLGRNQGVAQVKRLTFTGPLAWFMGRSYHLLMMPGLARKSRVVSDWTISLFFPRDVSQLGGLGRPTPLPPPEG
ncbi:MAG: NAD(P)/FAD-dependent oxidoreductase [Actinobacteria bacterium]|nr:NAD(P)/FAD-dependent oxidoreductase [Actinomycetota bacterium]